MHIAMSSANKIQADSISAIDFDLAIDRDCFAQTTIQWASPRCKVFYCFKNDDTREDGEDRCSEETFATICNELAENLHQELAENSVFPAIKCSIVLHLKDKSQVSFTEKSITAPTLKKFINLLSEKIDEFTFLTAFKYHI